MIAKNDMSINGHKIIYDHNKTSSTSIIKNRSFILSIYIKTFTKANDLERWTHRVAKGRVVVSMSFNFSPFWETVKVDIDSAMIVVVYGFRARNHIK